MRFSQALPCPEATRARAIRASDDAPLSAADKLTVVLFALGAILLMALVLQIRVMHSEKVVAARQTAELRLLSEEALALLSKERSDGSWRSRRIAELLEALGQADNAIATLDTEVTVWQKKHSDLSSTSRRATDEWSTRNAALARIVNGESTLRQREKTQNEAHLADAAAQLQEARLVIERAAMENRHLASENHRLSNCISSLESDVGRVRCQRDSALAAESRCQSEKSSLCSEISSLRSEVSALRRECARMR